MLTNRKSNSPLNIGIMIAAIAIFASTFILAF